MNNQIDLKTQPSLEMEHKVIDNQTETSAHSRTVAEIQAWLVAYLSEALEINLDEVNPSQNLQDYGLDSSAAVGLTGDLGDWLGREIDPTLLLDYTTIEAIAKHLGEMEEIFL